MRKYSSNVSSTITLGTTVTSSSTSWTLSNGSSLPVVASPDTLTLVIEPDTANEEVVYVTAHTSGSNTITVLRGQESTSAIGHSAGVPIKHMVTAQDLQEPHYHINASNYAGNASKSVHGIGSSDGDVVGTAKTQTLTNKTISGASNTLSNIPQASVTNLTTDLASKAPLANPVFTTGISFEGTTNDANETLLTVVDPTADRTITLPDRDGTVALTSGSTLTTTTLTNPTINAATATGTVDVSGAALAMGTTGTITANSATITATELSYLDGINENIKNALANKVEAKFKEGRTAVTLTSSSYGTVTLDSTSGWTGWTTATNPIIIGTCEDSTGKYVMFTTARPTASSVTIGVRHVDNTAVNATVYVNWVAFGH